MKKATPKTIAEEMDRVARAARREGWNQANFKALKAIRDQLEEMRGGECLTIGNANPPGLHCFNCMWNHLYGEVEHAVKFWSENEEARKKALS